MCWSWSHFSVTLNFHLESLKNEISFPRLANVLIFFFFFEKRGSRLNSTSCKNGSNALATAEDHIAFTNIRHLLNSLQAHTKTAASILSQNWFLITYKDWILAGRRIDVVKCWKSSNKHVASSSSRIFLHSHLARQFELPASARNDARKIVNVIRTKGEGAIYFWKKKERKWNEMRLKPKYISCPVECASQISSIYQGDKTDIAIYSNNIRKLLRDKIPQAVVYKRKSR